MLAISPLAIDFGFAIGLISLTLVDLNVALTVAEIHSAASDPRQSVDSVARSSSIREPEIVRSGSVAMRFACRAQHVYIGFICNILYYKGPAGACGASTQAELRFDRVYTVRDQRHAHCAAPACFGFHPHCVGPPARDALRSLRRTHVMGRCTEAHSVASERRIPVTSVRKLTTLVAVATSCCR